MFIVLLKFSDNSDQADNYMEGHKRWVRQGFEEGIFLLAGSLQPGLGGGIIAHNVSLSQLQRIVNEDPFVSANVVSAQILEITPSLADERLQFLVEK